MVVEELVAELGVKIEQGEFADAFALFDHLEHAFEKVFETIKEGIEKAFETVAEVAELGHEVEETAMKFGLTTEALQQFQFAAKLSGLTIESFNNGLKFLSKNAVEAADGSEELSKAFHGINLRDVHGKMRPVDDLLVDVAESFAKMPNGAEKAERAIKIFGRSGIEMIPMLNQGKAGIAALREEAMHLGVVLDEHTIESSIKFIETSKKLSATIDGLRNKFAAPNITKQTGLFESVQKIMAGPNVSRFIEGISHAFGRLLDTLTAVVDFFGWLGDAIGKYIGQNTLAQVALFALTSVVIGLALSGAAAGAAMVGAALATAGAWILAALPFIALGALIALIVDDIYTFIEGGDSLLGRIEKWFNTVDPSDNAFIKLLKAAGALLLDLTDVQKWVKLGQAIKDLVMKPIEWLIEKFPGLKDPLSLNGQGFGDAMASKFPGAVKIANGLGGAADAAGGAMASLLAPPGGAPGFPGEGWTMPALPGGSVSPSASAAAGASVDASQRSTAVHSVVNVTVPPGTDAAGVGEAVRVAVRDELGSHLQDARAAHAGN